MLTLILLVILLIGCLMGLKRGFVFQMVHLVSLFIAFYVAYLFYDDLASRLHLWIPYPTGESIGENNVFAFFSSNLHLQDAYYNAIAFAAIFFVTKIVLHILGSMLDFLADLPVLHMMNRSLGALLGFVEVYIMLFIVLYFAALVPLDTVQSALSDSSLAHVMIEKTPVFSGKLKELWIEHITSQF